MFADVSLRSQKVRCVGVVILAVAFNGFRSVLVALVFALFAPEELEDECWTWKMVLVYGESELSLCSPTQLLFNLRIMVTRASTKESVIVYFVSVPDPGS